MKFNSAIPPGATFKFVVPKDKKLNCKDTDIVIIDEIDYVLIDMQTNFEVYNAVKRDGKYKQSKKMPTIIGLTATSFNELNPDEQMFLTGSHHTFNF